MHRLFFACSKVKHVKISSAGGEYDVVGKYIDFKEGK